MKKYKQVLIGACACLTLAGLSPSLAQAEAARYDTLANAPTPDTAAMLKEELAFQRATQAYIWALPALNMYAMKDASEKTFGKGYNVLPIFKERLNAKTLITTPNSDVIYALGYLDLKEDGPMVVEAPPGLQGIIVDFWQRPICSEGNIEKRQLCGDVGLPGPDKGKGGKYLVLPPDYNGDPPGLPHLSLRAPTASSSSCASSIEDPGNLAAPGRS